MPKESSVTHALDRHPHLDLLYRLYAKVAPLSDRLIKEALHGQEVALQSIADLPTLLTLFDQYPQEVSWTCVHHRLVHSIENIEFYTKMIKHPLSQVRMALTRLLPTDHPGLDVLKKDQNQGVAWMAQVAQRGGFNPDLLKKRLGPHDRLDLPSAHPPYGLRPHDTLPQV
jgi:hypothetical protein